MKWINFLHIYQPANTEKYVIEEATKKCYLRVIRALEEHAQAKFTVNISGCLIQRWNEMGYSDLIKRINQLVAKGQIELTGTACYHPILPLIPREEVIRQIQENEQVLQKHFGSGFKPAGFFFPEMAYSPEAARIVRSLGYKWLILDEIAFNGRVGQADYSQIYRDKASGLKVVLRSRSLSNSYVPETISKLMVDEDNRNKIFMTATDGEIYGLRHEDPTAIFEKLLKNSRLAFETISAFIKTSPKTIGISPLAHSWVTSERELKAGQPFNLWQEKTNTIQKKLWELADFAYATMEKNKKDKNYHWARWHFVRGLASCTFWWASAKDFLLFSPLSWSPDEIERGTNELIRSVRSLESEQTREEKIKAEKIYIAIKKMAWQRHWVYYWKKT